MKKFCSKSFQYSDELVEWVNKQNNIEICSVTSNGQFEGEGYKLFYYEFILN